MKLPNGYGSIYKLTGKRRRPWVCKKLISWEQKADGKRRPVYGIVGYYATKAEALENLAKYNENPVDLRQKDKTFTDVFSEWSEAKFGQISRSMSSDYKGAYKYCGMVHDRVFKELTAYDYENMVKATEIPRSYLHRINVLLSQMYQYAMKHGLVTKNVAELTEIHEDNDVRSERQLFAPSEVELIKAKQGDVIVDIVLVCLYTGMRPSEVVCLRKDNINLRSRIITGGSKTKAGKNRKVPIHPEIMPIIERRVSENRTSLFVTEIGTEMTYKTYRLGFNSLITGHTPYDTRHTFASNWHLCGLDPLIEKLILGHAVTDITKGVYTHIPDEKLVEEMGKYRLCSI